MITLELHKPMQEAVGANDLCNRLLRRSAIRSEIPSGPKNKALNFVWGSPLVFGTAAYWLLQCHLYAWNREAPSFALGANLFEETVACLLGGYGIPAEVGLAAFHELRKLGLTDMSQPPAEEDVLAVLRAPLSIGEKKVHYRFPRLKAKYIAAAGRHFQDTLPASPTSVELRDWLLEIPGIGLKTASWIVRNSTKANDVAIIDIHIRRAGVHAGFFRSSWEPGRDYAVMEKAFLSFATQAAVPAAALDTIMWLQMRSR